MLTVTIDEALARIPQLIEAAAQGEHVLIASRQAGDTVALPAYLHNCVPTWAMKGRISIAEVSIAPAVYPAKQL
jgi:hypothetical protein